MRCAAGAEPAPRWRSFDGLGFLERARTRTATERSRHWWSEPRRRALLAICDSYSRKGRGLSPEELGERFRLALDRVAELLGQLHKHGYIVDTDTDDEAQVFGPARPLDQIKLIDVLVLFDHEQSQQTRADSLGKVFEDLDEARLRIVAETSYAALVRKPRP